MEDVLRIVITSGTNWKELHEDILRGYDPVLHTEIWLDFSTESWFSIDNQRINETVYEFIHNTIRNTGLDWNLFTFINGNVYTQYNYSKWREIFKVQEEIKTSYYPLWHKMTADMHLDFSYQNEQHKDTYRTHYFSCLNGAPRDHRIKTEKFIKENNLLDKSRYTFYWNDETLDQLSLILPKLSAFIRNCTVEFLRNKAISLENTDLKLAIKMMLIAKVYRPNGPVINKKINEYRKKLSVNKY